MKQIVGRFNEDYNKILFYEILFDYKDITILKPYNSNDNTYYAYDNKGHILGRFPISVNTEIKPEDVPNLKIVWLPDLYLFFWADSRLVKDYGMPYYNKLISLYKQMRIIRLQEEEIYKLLSTYEFKNIFEKIYCYARSRFYSLKQRRAFRKPEKELKIIW